jgi:phospho-N-acetylmuramoyl-pentapeptide-transferase
LCLVAGAWPFGFAICDLQSCLHQLTSSSHPSVLLLDCFLCGGLSFLLVMALGRAAIWGLRRFCRERIDTASPRLAALHAKKAGTPSMGGILIFGCWLAAVAIRGDFRHTGTLIAIGTAAAFAALGFCDDLVKSRGRRGLRARTKLLCQLVISTAAVAAIRFADAADLSLWQMPLACLLIAAMSNAVNVTDGLDGLAAGCGALTANALAVAASCLPAAGAMGAARHEQLAILAASLAGSLGGFLWFNRSPARIFMGDTGSLPLGGLLGVIAILLRCEWWLLVVGGVFVAELASVALQVGWYRRTGRRLFRCAPLHHHYEFLGWSERVIVRRFWAAAAGCALLAIALLWFAPATSYLPIEIR